MSEGRLILVLLNLMKVRQSLILLLNKWIELQCKKKNYNVCACLQQ
jgi:hypothetical protein